MSTDALPADRSAPGNAAPAAAEPSAAPAASARRGVLAYLLLVVVLTAVVDAVIFATAERALILVLMWMPAVASILVRLVRREGFAGVSFHFGGRPPLGGLPPAPLPPFAHGPGAHRAAWGTWPGPLRPPRAP